LLPEINALIVLLMTDQAVSQRAEVSAKGPDLWRTRKFGSIERRENGLFNEAGENAKVIASITPVRL
jgi:hypothetical protein